MKASDLKNDNVPTSLHRSLRNRPSQLLYQPPARRCADKPLKSSCSIYPKSESVKSETHSTNSCLPKLAECEREPLCGSKEQEPLAHSRISPSSPSSQEDLEGASYTRLKPTEDQCLSERKPGLGRGNLLKLQLLYEHKYVKADKINDNLESQNSRDKVGAVHVPNVDKPAPQLSADVNHNNNNHHHLSKPFLKIPDSDFPSPKFHNAATPKQIQNDFKHFVCEKEVRSQNSKCQENILPPPIEVQSVSEEAVCRMGGDNMQNIAKSFGSGDWEPKADASNSPGLDLSLLFPQKSPSAKNEYSSVPNHSFSLTVSNGDSKEATEIFYSSNQSGEEESADVFDSQASSLSDETYLTVSSHLSDVEENTESINRSNDGCDQDSLLSESNSWAECILDNSAGDVSRTSAKTSFCDGQDENSESSESSLSFQEKAKEEVMNSVDSRDRINHYANYQAGDNQLSWSTTRVKNHISPRECSTRHPKLKFSPKPDKCQKSDLSAISSIKYSSLWSPNSDQKRPFFFCPSIANYQAPTPLSPQTLMASNTIFENPSSCRASQSPQLPILQSCNKENISKELAKRVSCKQVDRTQRHSWSETKSGDCIINALRSHVKEISFRNEDHWKQSALQYKQIFGSVESCPSWKENYRKMCSEAGHKFLDTHCHIDMMFNEHLDRIYGTFQEYREANADSFPHEFGGCVAIFCNPLTFNPRGSLFRSLVNEHHVWIAVGCHPKKVKFLDKRTLQQLNECIRMPQVVAVGEIGLDYSGMFYLEAEVQKEVFRTQIKLALDVSKPIVIHCRDAEDDCFSILKAECPLDWLIHLHCYMLDFEHAQKWLDTFSNLYIGLTPKVTYRNAFDVHDTARKIPLTRLVLESDAPYFIPSMVPYNQLKCSHPGLVFTVAETVAKLQSRDVKEVLKACWDNSHRLYRINPDT